MKKAAKWKARTNLMIENFSAVEGDGDDGQRSHQAVEATMRGSVDAVTVAASAASSPEARYHHPDGCRRVQLAILHEKREKQCYGRSAASLHTSAFESWQLGRDRSPSHVEFTIARKT